MSRFVVNESETLAMREDVLGAVIAVAKGVGYRQHPFDDRLHGARNLGPPLLNPAIERVHAQLHENRVVAKSFNQAWVSAGGFVDLSKNQTSALADGLIYLSAE